MREETLSLCVGQILIGPLFNEPMRLETVQSNGGARKTIMSGRLIRELELRGLAERILIVCPANLAFQWQRELNEKFDTKFLVMKGQDIREQFGVNQWLERNRVVTSLDLAKRSEILRGLRQVATEVAAGQDLEGGTPRRQGPDRQRRNRDQ
jgi:SNF2 family DNA or RNA helicase